MGKSNSLEFEGFEKQDKLFFWAILLCGMMIGFALSAFTILKVSENRVNTYSQALTNQTNKYDQCFKQLEYTRQSQPKSYLIPNSL